MDLLFLIALEQLQNLLHYAQDLLFSAGNPYEYLSALPILAAAAKGGAASGIGSGIMGQGGGSGILSQVSNAGSKPVKATLGLATGLIQGIQAARAKKKAEAAFPELVDPNQAAYLSELRQKSRSIETGADFQAGMQSADQTNASTNDAILRSTGGDAGGTIQALLQSQATAGQAKNQILGQGQAQQFNYDSAMGSQLNLIAQRTMELQMQRSQQARAEWDRKSKLASANAMAGLTSLIPGGNQTGQPPVNIATSGSAPNMDFSQLAQMSTMNKNLAGKPAAPAGQIETTGVQSPMVVPAQPNINQGSGVPINLLQR